MIIEQIQTQHEFLSLRAEWNELLQSASNDCVFLTHEWLYTWWKHLAEDRTLLILTVRTNGVLEAIVPLALRRAQYSRMTPQMLEFIGSGVIGSDYLDLIVRRESEERVLPEITKYLNKIGFILQLSQLRGDSNMAAELARQLATGRWTITERKVNVCPFIRLDSHTWESYLASLSSNHRYNFQRRCRKLTSIPGFQMVCASTAGEATSFLDVLIDLHRKRWTSRPEVSEAFQTAEVVAFHREFVQLALELGWLRLWTICLGDWPVSALYGLRYRGNFSFYQSGFDPAYSQLSPGLVIMGLSIRKAMEEGASEYDFLHGDEEYKFHWTRETRDLGRIELFPPHSKTFIYKHAISLNRAARQLARRVLTRG